VCGVWIRIGEEKENSFCKILFCFPNVKRSIVALVSGRRDEMVCLCGIRDCLFLVGGRPQPEVAVKRKKRWQFKCSNGRSNT